MVLIGALMHDLSLGESFKLYALLTIGDGLAAQIPALLLHIVVPNYEVTPAYQSLSVNTRDGRAITGPISSSRATPSRANRSTGSGATSAGSSSARSRAS